MSVNGRLCGLLLWVTVLAFVACMGYHCRAFFVTWGSILAMVAAPFIFLDDDETDF